MNRVDIVAVTHRGRERERNEDTVAVAGFQSGALEGQPVGFSVAAVRPVTLLVADGLGGHPEGGRASRLAAAVVADAAASLHTPDAVVSTVAAANDAIYREMAHVPGWSRMGATIVVLVLTQGRAICVNVGDSRCFLLRGTDLVQLTRDDSPAPPAGATAVATVVTQTLGGRPARTAVEPHVYRTAVEPGDRFLLCSDGLTDELDPGRIEKELVETADQRAAVEGLLRAVLDAGARDNISIVVADIPRSTAQEGTQQ
ncbi:protein phosphatase 2C domain-containing protein [Actinoplanes sp. NPDC026623]|uniref:PP2C family protein-serine/threonine phosphatase n=1 Tax=Actinoplanes sp. NPDC026623 TaxID=3155610 RepID=UPI0033F468B5